MADEIGPDDPTRSAGVVETRSLRAWGLDRSDDAAVDPDVARRRRLSPRTIVVAAVASSLLVVVVAAVVGYRSLTGSGAEGTQTSPTPPQAAAPSVSVFDGTYRVFHDWKNTTFSDGDGGSAGKVQWKFDEVAPDYWYAFSSTCTKTECIATGTPLDDRRVPLENGNPVVMRLVGDAWNDMAASRWQEECTDPSTGAVIGRAWNSQRLSFQPRDDGTFVGTLTTRVDSDECGDEGTTARTPLVATRMSSGS
ncbi:hypothetical protein [Mycolicibacterium sediminis]|uniref:Uncharacterized protein n=1 Tax=Mycolicibacterium sediminis TaxID=1286180 RepID=A0A7I7QRL8_9MYCO|nr:hypothetical protein [Mycolicibacterium sediminis]BBY28964.1 hypothetical protein MSEDJ_30600 [Mycolicibacterium sediminis]